MSDEEVVINKTAENENEQNLTGGDPPIDHSDAEQELSEAALREIDYNLGIRDDINASESENPHSIGNALEEQVSTENIDESIEKQEKKEEPDKDDNGPTVDNESEEEKVNSHDVLRDDVGSDREEKDIEILDTRSKSDGEETKEVSSNHDSIEHPTQENLSLIEDFAEERVASVVTDNFQENGPEQEEIEEIEAMEEGEESYNEFPDEQVNEEEFVVLDPDHPLMVRFQGALKKFLSGRKEKVTLDLSEKTDDCKRKKLDRENLGVELYGIQQELAKYQLQLENMHDDKIYVARERQKEEQDLEDLRTTYAKLQTKCNQDKIKQSSLMTEVENLALRLHYMENAKTDVHGDISVMKRAAEKADTEFLNIEKEKQKQDFLVDRLVERVDKLKEDIAICEAQLHAQGLETKAAKHALGEAHMEIETISMEKKHLFQQWNSSLIGMKRRDEAYSAMQQATSDLKQQMLALETELEGYKKSIQKEQEQNEKLTLLLNKTDGDISTSKKQLASCIAKYEALKVEYNAYTRILSETETSLSRETDERDSLKSTLDTLRKNIEKEYLEKVRLQDAILQEMRDQLTMDKAAEHTAKLIANLQCRTREMDNEVAVVESKIAQDNLDATNGKVNIEKLQDILAELSEEIAVKNENITKCETEMRRGINLVERKQTSIDQYNKKLEQMISSAGGIELGPLEIQINSLQKSIDMEESVLHDLQQMWLRQQNELVTLTKDRQKHSDENNLLTNKLTILSQKKIRLENEVHKEEKAMSDVDRQIRQFQHEMICLNKFIHREESSFEQLLSENTISEGIFVKKLKEAEKESVVMQESLEGLKEEKEGLLNALVEAERQIMLWEKKTQLARETRSAVDSEVGQSEIGAMKSEIHRMEMRHSQLMRQQEKMILEMEKAVSRKDTIVTRGDAKAKMHKKITTKGSFQRHLTELTKKIKHVVNDCEKSDQELRELRNHAQDLGSQIEERQVSCSNLQRELDNVDSELSVADENKYKGKIELYSQQKRAKYIGAIRDGKYKRLISSDEALQQEYAKQIEKFQELQTIIDQLHHDFPHFQSMMRPVTIELRANMGHIARIKINE